MKNNRVLAQLLSLILFVCMLTMSIAVIGAEVAFADDSIFLGERYWEKIFENYGTISCNQDAGSVTFSCDVPYSQGGQLGIQTPLTMQNDAFDIAWTMSAESYSGRESVIVYTGSYRMYLVFSNGHINLQSIGRIGYPMTLEETQIRVVGKRGKASGGGDPEY